MTRISISLQKDLVNEFDEILKQNGYKSRRNGLQDAIREYIDKHKKIKTY